MTISKRKTGKFPGSPAVRAPRCHCRGSSQGTRFLSQGTLILGQGTRILHAAVLPKNGYIYKESMNTIKR